MNLPSPTPSNTEHAACYHKYLNSPQLLTKSRSGQLQRGGALAYQKFVLAPATAAYQSYLLPATTATYQRYAMSPAAPAPLTDARRAAAADREQAAIPAKVWSPTVDDRIHEYTSMVPIRHIPVVKMVRTAVSHRPALWQVSRAMFRTLR